MTEREEDGLAVRRDGLFPPPGEGGGRESGQGEKRGSEREGDGADERARPRGVEGIQEGALSFSMRIHTVMVT